MLGVAWLGVFGFSAVPVFMFYNIWSTCEVIKSPQTNGTAGVEQICVDIRQYGTSFSSPRFVGILLCMCLGLSYLHGRLSIQMGFIPSIGRGYYTLSLNVLHSFPQCAPFSGWKHQLGSKGSFKIVIFASSGYSKRNFL